ncbi:MAG: hypothetical protein ABEI27_13230 [Halobellus sp.]|uniref:DUF7289 family protein n=1 Tax=Halobellus sp. TaxID=1979212 RepID=UPI0035D3EB48
MRCDGDRGVSETVSFVLVFSLVVASVGTVYAVGVSELEATRDAEQVDNAQRAFDVLADNVRDLFEGAPSRGTEVKIAGATIRAASDAEMNVTVDPGGGGTPQSWDYRLSPIVYDVESGGEIRLSNGAVLRDSARGGATVVRDAPIVVDDNRLLLRLVKQEHVGSGAVGGSGTVRVRMATTGSRVFYDEANPDNHSVRVNVTSPYTDAWARHYESLGFTCTEVTPPTAGTPGTTSCTISGVERVTIVWTRITTSFE